MRTCHECGEQFRNNANENRCRLCVALFEPVAVWARNAVTRAVKRGDLTNLKASVVACVDCGNRADRYDHRDYLKPLDVVPVCHTCNFKRGPAIPCIYRVTDERLLAAQRASRERRESILRSIYGDVA